MAGHKDNMSGHKSGHKRKNLLSEQRVIGGSKSGKTGTPGKGDVADRAKIPRTSNLMRDQMVVGLPKKMVTSG